MKLILTLASVFLFLIQPNARAQFSGDFELGPAGCEAKGECTLTYDLRFRDPRGLDWQAAAMNKTDGASIPLWARPFVGDPFDKSYIKAAVIHDHYCDRHVRSWRETHRVFYDALLDLKVSANKAKLMYYAVYLGGPKWVELIPGKSCGGNCVFRVENEAASTSKSPVKQFVSRSDTYDEPGFTKELEDAERLIQDFGDKADLKFLERRAEKLRPDDFFYKNGDRAVLGGALAVQ